MYYLTWKQGKVLEDWGKAITKEKEAGAIAKKFTKYERLKELF